MQDKFNWAAVAAAGASAGVGSAVGDSLLGGTNALGMHSGETPASTYISNGMDKTLIGAGSIVSSSGKFIEENPVAKYALIGLEIAAGPGVFMIRQAIDHSIIGDAIHQLQDAAIEHVAEGMSKAAIIQVTRCLAA